MPTVQLGAPAPGSRTAGGVDLVFGHSAQLWAIAETYAFEGAEETFVRDFADAWERVI